jgi:hypothetical protein
MLALVIYGRARASSDNEMAFERIRLKCMYFNRLALGLDGAAGSNPFTSTDPILLTVGRDL